MTAAYMLLVLAFAVDWEGTGVTVVVLEVIIRQESSGRALVMGLESLGGGSVCDVDVDKDLEFVFVRVVKDRREVPEDEEKGLAFVAAPEDSEGRRMNIVSRDEVPAVFVSVKDPTEAYWAGGGLFRKNSTTFPGSPSARRWK